MMQPGLAARIAAADVDPVALQQPPVAKRRVPRRTLAFVIVGVISYICALVALLPARMVLSETESLRVGGTIWNGEAVIASAIHVDWQFSLIRSLTDLAYSADFHMTGGATDLAGGITQAGDVMRFREVSGQLDETLWNALGGNLPMQCRFVADVAIEKLVLGGNAQMAEATMQVSPSTCTAAAVPGVPAQLPAARFSIVPNGSISTGALVANGSRMHLLEARLTRDGALSIWPTALASELTPVLAGIRYDTKID
jgi:hypothetical protein